jgi:hypothetical protein
VIRTMLWQQGESDSMNGSYGLAYDKNLSHLIKRVRAQFNAPHMSFVYGQVLPMPLGPAVYRNQVRQGQFNVDEDSEHVFATDGACLVLADDLSMNSDNLHLNAAGQLKLGTRLADAVGSVMVASSVNFNGDGIINEEDMCLMVDHWHTNEPAYDIAPVPFGDGIVDAQDLVVLSENLFVYPGAVAHWMLDETEGDVAYDNVADHDALVMGDPLWLPHGGHVHGAIQLDGIDDYAETPFVLNPKEGIFSVVAWINGGGPGQVILSQANGVNWLWADPVEGKLMTSLTQPVGRFSPPAPPLLVSDVVITDGNWHQIGLVWDKSERILYVDDVEVARDAQPGGLKGKKTSLYMGAGKDLTQDSFWGGLIDDVCLYDRVVGP